MKRIEQHKIDKVEGVRNVHDMIACAQLEMEDGPFDLAFVTRAEIAVKFILVIKGGELSQEEFSQLMFELESQGYEEDSIKNTFKGLAFLARLVKTYKKKT